MPELRNAFATTHWSVVLHAARDDSPEATIALEKLCADYWYPLYAFLRRRGHSPEEAEDLTQSFFAERIIERRILRAADPTVGRFRSWLLTCLQNMAASAWERRQSLRRGGRLEHVPMGSEEAERLYATEPGSTESPEHIYDRAWAMTVLRRTLDHLKNSYADAGQLDAFHRLQAFLPGSGEPPPYETVAQQSGKSIDAVKMSVSRLRQEFRRQLRAELLRTVSSPEEIHDELRHLQAILAS